MEPPIVILYTKEEWLEATVNSIKLLGLTNTIIPIMGSFDKPLKKYQIVSYLWKTKILPQVKETDFYYTEEGTLWKSIPKEVSHSYWHGYTKITDNRPVGIKVLFFKAIDYYKLELLFSSKLFHTDFMLSKCDWLEWGKKEDFQFKLLPRRSYFNTKHPKKFYTE